MRLRLFTTVITLVLLPVMFVGCYGWTTTIYGIWGSSASDVFAVGDGGTILHYDGSNWSKMYSGAVGTLQSVWGSSSSDVFAVRFRSILHYDGSTVDEGCYWIEMLIP